MSIVFVISAPSGSGKTTLVRELLREDRSLQFAISVTTRPKRNKEVQGSSYHFVSKKRFQEMIDTDEFLEWADVFGYQYGTLKLVLNDVEQTGKDLLMDIDVQGASSLTDKVSEVVSIFILPPSRRELELRLRNRSSDTEEVIKRRLQEASREIRECTNYDHIVVNDNLDVSLQRIHAIIASERMRSERMSQSIQPILKSFELNSAVK